MWHEIEKTHIGESRPVWNALTLSIAKEIAKGNVQIVIPRKNNSPEPEPTADAASPFARSFSPVVGSPKRQGSLSTAG